MYTYVSILHILVTIKSVIFNFFFSSIIIIKILTISRSGHLSFFFISFFPAYWRQETTGIFFITHCMPWWVQWSYYQLYLSPQGHRGNSLSFSSKSSLFTGVIYDVFAVRIAAGIRSLNTFSLLRFYHFIKVIYFHRWFKGVPTMSLLNAAHV